MLRVRQRLGEPIARRMKEQSYIVVERFVDLNGVMRGIRHLFPESDTLIKYSKKEHSPVSSVPSDSIRLGSHDSFGDYIKNPGLVGDDTEGEYKEIHDWTKRESRWGEARKKSLMEHSPILNDTTLRNVKFKMKMTMSLNSGSWLYSTSIDPKVNAQRIIQMKRTDPAYNFMTKIDEPTAFAQQLGRDFGKQIDSNRDLKCDSPGLYMLASAVSRQSGIGGYSISVSHGPVIYLDEKEAAEFIDYTSKKMGNRVTIFIENKKGEVLDDLEIGNVVALFVKDKKYQVQQEYRFVVSVNWHSPSERAIFLKVSDDLKKFMSPLFL